MFHMSLKNTSGRVILMREHPKKMFGGSKPSSKLTLVNGTSCGCSDDSQNCEQLKKRVTGKYFGKKLDF